VHTGPVVRITPDEVHLSDTANYESIYHVGSKYSKGPFYDCFGLGSSVFTTKDNEIHRIRRGALNPFFSRKKVLETEEIVQSKVEKLIRIARKKFAAGQAIDLHHGFRAVSVDVMTEYCYGECFNTLDHEDLGDKFNAIFRRLGPSLWIGQQWPTLHKFGLSLPAVIASAMSSAVGEVVKLQEASSD
jgi:cytochrome P450